MDSLAAPELAAKSYWEGTHRAIPPAQTLQRIQPLLPIFGITRIADLTRLDRVGLPVVQCVRPNARSLSVSQGKGLDLISAKVSALMESIETFHAETIELPLRFAAYEDLCYRETLARVEDMVQDGTGFDPLRRTMWIGVTDLADSAIIISFRPWVLTADYWQVRSDLLERIKAEFDAADIGIPFPQMDVHLDPASANA